MIGIIGAMDAEVEEYAKNLTTPRDLKWQDFTFKKGRLFGKEVVIVKSGLGKVFASLVCQKLIDEFDPQYIIFTGVAGSLNQDLEIGDVVVSRDCVHHDLDVEDFGFPRGTIPLTNYRFFEADKKLRRLALFAKIPRQKIIEGRILTGDQFLTRKKINEYRYLTEELQGDVIEMEGAAIAQTCTINQTPFLIIRTVSDKADGNAVKDFNKFLPIVAKNSFQIVKNILQGL